MPMLKVNASVKFNFLSSTCNYAIERANQRHFAGTTHATPTLSLSPPPHWWRSFFEKALPC